MERMKFAFITNQHIKNKTVSLQRKQLIGLSLARIVREESPGSREHPTS